MILFIFLSIYLFPSNVERSLAIVENPAGIGLHQGIEMSYLYRNNSFLFTLNRAGYGIGFRGDTIDYYTGSTLFNYLDRFSFGVGYLSKYNTTLVGTVLRPISGLSIGAVLRFPPVNAELSGCIGLSVRPIGDRLTLSGKGDLSYGKIIRFNSKNIMADIEPINGINIGAGYDFDNRKWVGKLTLSLGHLRALITDNSDRNRDFAITASLVPYASFFKSFPHSVIVKIEGDYPETPTRIGLLGRSKCFVDLLSLLKEISNRTYIKKVLILLNRNTLGIAQAEEVRGLIKNLSLKKEVIAYSNSLTLKNLYIGSACNKIVIPPSGEVYFPGISITKQYFKGALDKLGIKPQFVRIGKYKSAVESFLRGDMSEADKEQLTAYLNDIVDVVVGDISKSRNIDMQKLKSCVDSIGYFTASEAVKYHLVDTLMYLEQLKKTEKISENARAFRGKVVPRGFIFGVKPKIAILVAEGTIVQGKSRKSPIPIPFFGEKSLGAESFINTINELKKDRRIKGVILRVNSPGGDALASDLMWQSLRELMEKKPVVVSMSNVAASGGYLISSYGGKIFADKTSLTGSIGIFGGKFVTRDLYNKLGITHSTVKWGRHADVLSGNRPFDEFEIKRMERIIGAGYGQFLDRVSEGRKLNKSYVDSVGRGRIWSGLSAKSVRLADENGGLEDAIEEIKRESGIKGSVMLDVYPMPRGIFENFLNIDSDYRFPLLELLDSPYSYYSPLKVDIR